MARNIPLETVHLGAEAIFRFVLNFLRNTRGKIASENDVLIFNRIFIAMTNLTIWK